MDIIEKATIIHYHRHRIGEHQRGTTGSLGWRAEESQSKRFEVLAGLADLNGRSVMDLGCGQGDFKAFLDQRFSGFAYIGIDQMPEFIADASERYADDENTHFYQTDFSTAELPRVDYVFASGALGYRCGSPHWYTEMIARMYAVADVGLAFNMLDEALFPEHPLLRGHNPETIMAFCRGLSPRVELIRGYLPDDFTIFMYR